MSLERAFNTNLDNGFSVGQGGYNTTPDGKRKVALRPQMNKRQQQFENAIRNKPQNRQVPAPVIDEDNAEWML
jgi:hypothetical protein